MRKNSYDSPNAGNGLDVAGDYVYLADDTGGLRIIDRDTRTQTGFYDGNVADSSNGLRVINV